MSAPQSIAIFGALWLLILPQPVPGQVASGAEDGGPLEFKILTEVYSVGSMEPISSNVSVFAAGHVYDFRFSDDSRSPGEITIFSESGLNFELLDMAREIQLRIDQLQLLRIVDGMRDELGKSDATRDLAFEEFKEDRPADVNRVTVSNGRITYLAEGLQTQPNSIVKRYYSFLENYTLLSSSDPSQIPPFARMQLNRSIMKTGLIPEKVTRSIQDAQHRGSRSQLRSEHRLVVGLNDNDRRLIELARQKRVAFRVVDLANYRRLNGENVSGTASQKADWVTTDR